MDIILSSPDSAKYRSLVNKNTTEGADSKKCKRRPF